MTVNRFVSAAVAFFLVVVFFGLPEILAQEGIKERMRERLPEILQLKAEGIVGETNDGYLAFVGEKTVKEDLVQAENLDRRRVYAAIAQQQGTTAEFVGKRRAQQLAAQAKPGFWLQDESGSWYRKK